MHIFRKPSAVSWTFPDWLLVNSVVMKPPMRKPRGQSSLCTLPGPQLLGSMGTISYEFRRKGSMPWWGLWAPGHEPLLSAVSPLSFNELIAVELLGAPP